MGIGVTGNLSMTSLLTFPYQCWKDWKFCCEILVQYWPPFLQIKHKNNTQNTLLKLEENIEKNHYFSNQYFLFLVCFRKKNFIAISSSYLEVYSSLPNWY